MYNKVQPKKNSPAREKSIKAEDVEIYVPIPSDHIYGWVVVAAAFIANALVDGFVFNFSQFISDFQKAFSANKSQIIWVLSFQSGMYYIIGPITSALLNKFGFRITGWLGAVIIVVTTFLSSYCQSITCMILSFGAFTGAGFGMVSCTSALIIGHYFDKYRAVANAIAMCGTGAGTITIAFLFPLFSNFNLKRKLWIFSSLFLIVLFPAIATYKPVRPTKIKITSTPKGVSSGASSSSNLMNLGRSRIPTYADLLHANYRQSNSSFNFVQGRTADEVEKRKLKFVDYLCCRCSKKRKQDIIRPVYRHDAFLSHSILPDLANRYDVDDESYDLSHITVSNENLDTESVMYHLSVVRVPSAREVHIYSAGGCWSTFVRTLSLLLDLRFFKYITYHLVSTAVLMLIIGHFIPYIYLIDRQKTEMQDESYKYLLTVLGVSNILGRLSTGLVTLCPNVNLVYFYSTNAAVASLAVFLMCTTNSKQLLEVALLCILFGYSLGFTVALRTLLYVEMFGLEKLTNAYGLLSFSIGCGALLGPAITGHISEITESYFWIFILGGCALATTSITSFLALKVRNWEFKKKGPP